MKNNRIYKQIAASLISLALFSACNDDFLQDKQDYTRVTAEIYNDYAGANGRVNNIYALCLPRSNSDVDYDNPSTGNADLYGTSTEEYGSLSNLVSETALTNMTVHDFFYKEAKTSRSPWGRIRNCNDAIYGIENGALKEDEKKTLLGQVLFFRAWTYYRLVNTYGGVPIITKVQNPTVGQSGGLELAVPRSTTKECIEFIVQDLEKAAEYLPKVWNDENWGRITKGTALAVAGRVKLLYASPLFNRQDDLTRWTAAYDMNKRAIDSLKASNYYKLAYETTPGTNGMGWAKMFAENKSPEAIFVTLYNSLAPATNGTAPEFNNTWENAIRPTNTGGGGGRGTTAEMVDLFPMSSGKKAVDINGNAINGYDPQLFFKNRDPRFYRTFAFPGVVWTFVGNTKKSANLPYTAGTQYQLWNYAWYKTTAEQTGEEYSGYGADKLASNYKGVYIRKRTDELGAAYVYDTTTSTPFRRSAAPFIEIRYAEVLLNFAEAACGAGHGDEALEALRQIRRRVGYTGTCGLDDALVNDRKALFAAILYERQIELAYEGKRYEDMRRWLLWDGGVNFSTISGAPASWTLTGFEGNTCNYLGVKPLNGRRRNGIELRVSNAVSGGGLAELLDGKDPVFTNTNQVFLNNVKRPRAWNINTTDTIQRDSVVRFYQYNLTRKTRQVDTKDKFIQYRPEYYIVGLRYSAQTNNSTLLQTIGWNDYMRGGMGTFDPLAE